MNYAQATGYIQNLNRSGMKLGLERIERLLALLGNPEKSFRSILVGGTSGKGSTTVMIESILREAGFRTGLFVKPHLHDFRERISVNGKMISESDFVRLVEKLKPFADKMERESEVPTFFEFVTAMAFEYFKTKRIEFAAIEVGLGGRLDATNVLQPEVSVITNVSLEHTGILGETLEKIAFEKAGIIKESSILVTGSGNPEVLSVLEKTCSERDSKLIKAKELKNAKSSEKGNEFDFEGVRMRMPLAGKYQLKNAACAIAALRSLKSEIPLKTIKKGLEKVKWPGRFEIVNRNPMVILDGAKDAESVRNLSDSLELIKYKKLYTVFGTSKDKMFREMFREISGKTDLFVFTKHGVMDRGLEPEMLANEAKKSGKDYVIVNEVRDAVRKAISLAGKDDLILVTGSLFTVAEAREIWFKNEGKMGREFNENIKV